jgi:hypothetical protein
LIPGEYGVAFEYFSGKKNVVADALSFLDNHELKIPQIPQEEVLTIISGSDHNYIIFPIYTSLIFKKKKKSLDSEVKNYHHATTVPPYHRTTLPSYHLTTICNTLKGMIFCVIKIKSTFLIH